mmetsp:Transcript_14462/g.34146  ORF Transcript_14462/g.34146 Transcript_14462/m.34146 type:complete len:213 (-) Transcript_14462:297-935(-)
MCRKEHTLIRCLVLRGLPLARVCRRSRCFAALLHHPRCFALQPCLQRPARRPAECRLWKQGRLQLETAPLRRYSATVGCYRRRSRFFGREHHRRLSNGMMEVCERTYTMSSVAQVSLFQTRREFTRRTGQSQPADSRKPSMRSLASALFGPWLSSLSWRRCLRFYFQAQLQLHLQRQQLLAAVLLPGVAVCNLCSQHHLGKARPRLGGRALI